MSPRALTRLTFRAKRSPQIRLAKKKGCLDTNHCVTLRVFGKDFYPSVFGNGNFATCEVLTAATATGVHIGISVNQETPPFVDVRGRTAYDLQVCTGPTAKYIWFRALDASAKLNYGDTAHESSNFVKFTIEPRHHQVSSHHVRTLVNRGKIGLRSLEGGTEVLKRSDVESIRVARGTGNRQHRNGAASDED